MVGFITERVAKIIDGLRVVNALPYGRWRTELRIPPLRAMGVNVDRRRPATTWPMAQTSPVYVLRLRICTSDYSLQSRRREPERSHTMVVAKPTPTDPPTA